MTLDYAQLAACILLAILFIGMGMNHFRTRPRRIMARLIPPRMRWRGVLRPSNLVAFTGVCEILGGIGLLIPWTRLTAGVLLVLFLVAVFPANVHAARHPETFGKLSVPLLPRLIAQLVLVALIVFAVLPLS